MAIANTGVNMQFTANTAAAEASIASLERKLKSLQTAMNAAVGASAFSTSGMEVRVNSQVRSMDELTKSIQRGKLSYTEFANTIKGTNGLLEYQQRLHRANISSMRQLSNGQMVLGLDTRQIGSMNAGLAESAIQFSTAAAAGRAYGNTLMNLGKNMAFMGRQALLSVSAPILAAAAGTAVAAYSIDKQLTNIVKLSGDSSSAMQASSDDIRQASLDLATSINTNFGVAVKDTLELQGQFAALGKSGQDLKDATESTARLMRLGDLSTDEAMKFSNTMQTVFGQNNKELENSINLINEMENSTVLTMQDVSEAMPKIGPIVKAMGGDIKDTLVLLESMKRGGIDAVEGANAVKSVTGSLFRPTKKLRDLYKDMVPGDSIEQLISRNGNNIVKIIKDIGEKTKDWSPDKKLKLFYQIAGKEQAARMLQLADNLAKGNANVERTLGKSAAQLKATADKEIKDLMSSASAQFDVQMQRAILFAQRIGAHVLPILTKGFGAVLTILEKTANVVGSVLDKLGPLGTVLKYVAGFAALAAAAFGPLMLGFAAMSMMTGGVIKGLSAVTGVGARIQNYRAGNGFTRPAFMTAQQKAEQIAQEAQQAVMQESIATTKQLEIAIDKLTASYERMSGAAAGSAKSVAGTTAAEAAAAKQFNPLAQAKYAGQGTREQQESLNRLNASMPGIIATPTVPRSTGVTIDVAAREAERLAQAEERAAITAQRMGMAAGGAAIGVGLLGSQIAGTNQGTQNLVAILSTSLLAFSIFPGAMSKIFVAGASKVKYFGAVMLELVGMSSSVGGKIAGAFKKVGTSIMANIASLGAWGLAIAAAGAAAYAIYRSLTAESRKFREENDKINNSVEGWSKLLDFQKLTPGQTRNAQTGEAQDTKASLIEQAKQDENLGALIDRLKRESRDVVKLRGELYSQAVLLAQQGLNPEQIKNALEVLLNAANIAPEIKKQLTIEFTNFDVVGPEGKPLAQAASDKVANILGNAKGHTLSYWEQEGYGTGFLGTGFGGKAGGRDAHELSNKAKQEVNDLVNNLTESLDAVSNDPKKFGEVFQKWGDAFNAELDKTLQKLKPAARDKIKKVGLLDAELGDMFKAGEIDKGQYDKLLYQQNVMKDIMNRLQEKYGAGDQFKFMFKNMADASIMAAASMEKAIMTPTQAADKFKGKIASMGDEWKKMDDKTKISLLNFYRAAAGLSALDENAAKAAINAGNLGDDVAKAGDAAAQAQPDIDAVADQMEDKEVDWNLNVQVTGVGNDPSEIMDVTLQGYKDAMKKVQDDIFQAAADNAQANFDSRMDALKAEQDAAMKELDNESKAMDERYKQEEKAMQKAQDAEGKQFDKDWENRMDAEKQVYEDRIKAIEDAQAAEDDLERERERNAEREAARIRYLAGLMNNNIDMNVAISSGNLDEASRIAINQQQAGMDYANETFNQEEGWKKEDRDRGRKTAIDLIKEEEDARMKMLEEQKELERQAMEDRWAIQREEFDRRRQLEQQDLDAKRAAMQAEFEAKQQNEQRMFEQARARMQMELDTLRATLPRTTEEMNAQKDQIQAIYAQYGVQLTVTGDQWAQIIGNSLTQRVREARNQMSNDNDWNTFGQRVSEGVSRGAFNMSSPEFSHFLRTGEMPGGPPPAGRHGGGPVVSRGGYDKYNSRAGIPWDAPMRRDETMLLAQKGEYVIKRDIHRKLGTGFLNNLNGGMYTRHEGGPIGGDVAARHDGGPVNGLGVLGAAMDAAMVGGLISRAGLAMGNAMMTAVQSGLSGGGFIGEGAAKAAQDFARGETGKPYQYGGVGNPSWDCSGFMGAIWAILTGRDPRQRWFSTETFNGAADGTMGFKKGIDPAYPNGFTIGIMHGGGGPNSHMAGTLLGQPVEAGGHGVGMGPGYADARDGMFTDHWYLPGVSGKKPEPPQGGGLQRNYIGWSTWGIEEYGRNAMAKYGMSSSADPGGENVERWRPMAEKAMDRVGFNSRDKRQVDAMIKQIQSESGGNPNIAQQITDINGTGESAGVGLLQIIPATFASYRDPALPDNRRDPFANMVAALRYYKARYGMDLTAQWGHGHGYDQGGLAFGKGFLPKYTPKPERVLNPEQTAAFEDLVPILKHRFVKNGIIGYDDIVNSLRNDNFSIAAMSRAISSVANVANDTIGDINFVVQGDIVGVDDLEDKMRKFKDELMQAIKEENIKKQRRVGGR